MTQFLSPATNHRTDKWGGSRGNRVRFALSVIAESRKLVGDDFPIGIRVGVDGDGAERGLTREELADICAIIAPHVAFVSVSGGNYAGFGAGHELAYVSPWYEPPGSNVESARLIKAQCDVPIFVTGRIADPSIAEGILADGAADMIGMVRALVADPDMPRKVRDGHPERVRMCLSVSECHYIGPHRKPMNCAVNASAGREAEMVLVPASVPRTVIVVGAGPAGMEAARVSAERGHTVYLADRARQLGGTPAVLAMDPNRHNLRDQVAYFALELSRLGVTLLLGNEVTAEEILEFGPDVVVVATGGVQIVPDVPGVAGSHVFRGLDVLGGASIPQDRVIVVAGLDKGIAAGTVAEFLADEGKSVQLVSEQVNFAPGVEDGTRLHLLDRLLKKGVEISQFHRLERVTDDGAALVNIFTRGERTCSDTAVVLACGLVPDDHLFRALNGKVPVHAVGDALAPRRIAHATLDGARVARAI